MLNLGKVLLQYLNAKFKHKNTWHFIGRCVMMSLY